MNNIHEDDWAEDTWSRHSGMFVPDSSKSNESNQEEPDCREDETSSPS